MINISQAVIDNLLKLARKEKIKYLLPDDFVIQKDAFQRLANEVPNEVIVTLDYSRFEADDSLAFNLAVTNEGFYIFADIFVLSDQFSNYDKPQDIANNIFMTLKMLLNGQIAVLVTHNAKPRARELVISTAKDHVQPILVEGNILTMFWHDKDLDVHVHKNKINIARQNIPENFYPFNLKKPLSVKDLQAVYKRCGRQLSLINPAPLKRKQLSKILSELLWFETNKKPLASPWLFSFKQWETWAALAVIILLLSTVNYFTKFHISWGIGSALFGGYFYFVLPYLAKRKYLKKQLLR